MNKQKMYTKIGQATVTFAGCLTVASIYVAMFLAWVIK